MKSLFTIIFMFIFALVFVSCGDKENKDTNDKDPVNDVDETDDNDIGDDGDNGETEDDGDNGETENDEETGDDKDNGEEFLCEGIDVKSADDLESIKGCVEINGTVIFENADFTEIELPLLEKVKGSLIFGSYWDKVADSMVGAGNPSLETISLPELKEVTGDFSVYNNPVTTVFSAPKLVFAGEFWVENNALLESFDAGKLENVIGDMGIWDNPAIAEIELPSLVDIAGFLWVRRNAILEKLSMDALVSTGFDFKITSHDTLNTIEFSGLGKIGNDFYVRKNAKLPTSMVEALKEQVESKDGIGGSVMITDNLED